MIFRLGKTVIKIEFPFFAVIALAIVFKNGNIAEVLFYCAAHEMGHLVALLLCGGYPEKITLSYYGIGLKYDCNITNAKTFFVLIAGAAVNAVLALFNINRDINIALAFLNLLPVYPLDGGRILKLILSNTLNINIGDKIMYFISALIVACLFIFSIIFKNPSFLFIAIYVIVYSLNNSYE